MQKLRGYLALGIFIMGIASFLCLLLPLIEITDDALMLMMLAVPPLICGLIIAVALHMLLYTLLLVLYGCRIQVLDLYFLQYIRRKTVGWRVENTTVYVADVQIADISLLKTALAGNTYARNLTETTSVQAANAGAILAINGDYYGAQERGYVLRNGVLYRASAQSGTDALVIGADGNFRIIHEGETSADTLVREGAWQVLTFGPALINGGQVTVSSSDEVGRAMTSNPRTAIGQISEGHYLLVVSDGRTKESAGLSLWQLAELMQSLGAQIAYNLDGGGSSTMVFQERVVNNPTTNGRSIRERSVSDIVYIGY